MKKLIIFIFTLVLVFVAFGQEWDKWSGFSNWMNSFHEGYVGDLTQNSSATLSTETTTRIYYTEYTATVGLVDSASVYIAGGISNTFKALLYSLSDTTATLIDSAVITGGNGPAVFSEAMETGTSLLSGNYIVGVITTDNSYALHRVTSGGNGLYYIAGTTYATPFATFSTNDAVLVAGHLGAYRYALKFH